MLPAGRSSAAFCDHANVDVTAKVITARAAHISTDLDFTLCDMDLHLISGVIEIAAGIPYCSRRLSSSQ
jgi:hypothetical protein